MKPRPNLSDLYGISGSYPQIVHPPSSITALAVTNGTGTQQSPLTVTTYEELKAALADNTTQYIVVNEFETNYDDGYATNSRGLP